MFFFALKPSDKALILPMMLPHGGSKMQFCDFANIAGRESKKANITLSLCQTWLSYLLIKMQQHRCRILQLLFGVAFLC